MDLIPVRISRVASVDARQEIQWRNSSDAKTAVGPDHTEWVHKELIGAGQVLAEAIAFLLGNRLELPIPQGGILTVDEQPTWLSRLIPNVAHWKPSLFESIAGGPVVFGRMYVLDAIVGNDDRHDGNVLLQHTGVGVLRPWFIDFANAHISNPTDLRGRPKFVPSPTRAHLRPPPLAPTVLRAARQAAKVAEKIPRECLAADAHEACDAVRCPELEEDVRHVLIQRCGVASAILSEYVDQLRGCS
jgi:hypothetical protein